MARELVKSLRKSLFGVAEPEPTLRPITIVAVLTGETEKTIQVNFNDRIVWLQKSLIKVNPGEGNQVTLTIPFWLFARKFPEPKQRV